MDTQEFRLTKISEKSDMENNTEPVKQKKRNKRAPLPPTGSDANIENGQTSTSLSETTSASQDKDLKFLETSVESEKSIKTTSSHVDHAQKQNRYEVSSTPDEVSVNEQDGRHSSKAPSQLITDHDSTMVSSYTTGNDNDTIEIHQFSAADIDAYLDIYFETLDNRLKSYIGVDEQLQQFRAAMKHRISSNANAREYQDVLLGKVNGEVLAAVTMLFPKESPTIPQTGNIPQQNSCMKSVHHWMAQKSNYVPTNMEECYIEMIGVKSAYRNHGIGSAMLECVEYFAQQAGATLLTIHTNGPQLRNYFQRFGFTVDNADNSAFWKWIVERQSINKLSKILAPNQENVHDMTGSYINESMVGSLDE